MNDFKNLFIESASEYFISKGGNLEIDENIERYYTILSLYFSKSIDFEKNFKGKLQKGLLIFGSYGVGKTSAFYILRQLYEETKCQHLWLKMVSCNQVVLEYNLNNESKSSIINYYSKGNIFFDDLGAEPIASNYGKEDIFKTILELRYELFIEKGIKTHATTNLSFEEIKKRYGHRVFDRCKEMFNFIKVEGNSKRK